MDFMTIAEAAKEMGITPRALRQRIERGEVQVERVTPRLYLVPLSEVERWRGRGRLKSGPKPRGGSTAARRHGKADANDA